VQVADVHDDHSDENLERDAGDQQRQHKVVEAVTLTSDVEQKLEFGDLREAEDRDECRLRLRLRLFQLTVTRQQLAQTHTHTHTHTYTHTFLTFLHFPASKRTKFKSCCITHSVFVGPDKLDICGRCQAYLTDTVQSLNASTPRLGQRLRSTSSTDFSLLQLYVPSLENMLSRMPVPLHGTHCPNTSVLNLTFVFYETAEDTSF